MPPLAGKLMKIAISCPTPGSDHPARANLMTCDGASSFRCKKYFEAKDAKKLNTSFPCCIRFAVMGNGTKKNSEL